MNRGAMLMRDLYKTRLNNKSRKAKAPNNDDLTKAVHPFIIIINNERKESNNNKNNLEMPICYVQTRPPTVVSLNCRNNHYDS